MISYHCRDYNLGKLGDVGVSHRSSSQQVTVRVASFRATLTVFCLLQNNQRVNQALRHLSLSVVTEILSIVEHYSIRFTRDVRHQGQGPQWLG